MARRYILAGNWKMYKDAAEAVELIEALAPLVQDNGEVDIVVGPVFTSIPAVVEATRDTNIDVAAQNCHWEDRGAFTGEISPSMLKAAGVKYVIIGHSERRQFFGETDEGINKKAKALYEQGLTPIICCGESLEEREGDKTLDVVSGQLRACLAQLPADRVRQSVLAYEPVWAIGTGKVASAAQAQEVHAMIRGLLGELYDSELAESVRIQYGGSVKPGNVRELMGQADIDGALVGGAALDAESFAAIVNFSQ